MSDWELVDNESKTLSPSNQQPQSDWEVVNTPVSQRSPIHESIMQSVLSAPFRIGEDVLREGGKFASKVPGYLKYSKNEIPKLLFSDVKNPLHLLGQGLAGSGELFQNLANVPPSLAKYAANRLNLFPKSIANAMPSVDFSPEIKQTYGEPQNPGEELLRGIARNMLPLQAGLKTAQALNPLRLTASSITKDVLNTEKKQIAAHTKSYNELWSDAEKTGFNNVPVDRNTLSSYLEDIEKYKTPREYQSLSNLIENPTLEKAQKAQSDMGIISRALEEKSKKSSLTSEEKNLYNSAKNAEKHIEDNMFKNEKGEINEPLKNKYNTVTKSYRKNVVPYKYNQDIQAYKNEEMTKQELVKALSKGEFYVKRGKYHLPLKARKMLLPYTGGALGGYEVYKYLNKDNSSDGSR